MLIPALAVDLAPAVDRFGWYVDRRAFGVDLHEAWGATVLQLERGGSLTAAEHLELAWTCARRYLDTEVSDRRIPDVGSAPTSSPFGEAVEPRQRTGYRLEARIATWDFTVYRISGGGRTAFACVPRRALARFLDAIDGGELDGAILTYLRAATGGSPLLSAEQTGTPGLFAAVGPASSLLTEEGGLTFTGGGPRRGKRRRDDDHDQEQRDHRRHERRDHDRNPRARRMSSKAKVVAGAVVVLVAVAAIASATLGAGGDRALSAPSVDGGATGAVAQPPLTDVRVGDPSGSPAAKRARCR